MRVSLFCVGPHMCIQMRIDQRCQIPRELESPATVTTCVGATDQTWVLCKRNGLLFNLEPSLQSLNIRIKQTIKNLFLKPHLQGKGLLHPFSLTLRTSHNFKFCIWG